MDQYINQTQTLYDLAGARSFVFLTVPPIQYTPTVLSSGAENAAACREACAPPGERYEPWLACLREHCADRCEL